MPAVAVVPGGSANVLARSLGISRDPVAATNQLIQLIDDYRRHQTWRRIGLIDCGEQWAVINAGMGVDAEVVAGVEAQRDKGVKVTPLRYWRVAVPITIGFSRREPSLTLELPDRDPIPGVHFVWVSNTSPVDLQQQPADGDQPRLQLRVGPRGVRAHQHEGASHAATWCARSCRSGPNPQAKQLVRDDDAACLRGHFRRAPRSPASSTGSTSACAKP